MSENVYSVLSITLKGGVATITINNPPINLFDMTLIGELDQAGRSLAENPDVKVVILESSNPDFFIAHADAHLFIFFFLSFFLSFSFLFSFFFLRSLKVAAISTSATTTSSTN